MRRFAVAAVMFVALLAVCGIGNAGPITYSIQDYPADQNGATLSGIITTDGAIGNLLSGDILSWSWTITPVGGTPVTATFDGLGNHTIVLGSSVVSSASEITIAGPPQEGSLELFDISGNGLVYERAPTLEFYTGQIAGASLWATSNPSMGGTDPWVIAEAVAAVPEPSGLTLAGLGAVCGIAYGLARKARALILPRN